MTVEEVTHLNRLEDIRNRLQADPGICDPDVWPAAMDWLDGAIAPLKKKISLAG